MSTPTPGAIRAAVQWIEPSPQNRLHAESVAELATLIDKETGAPELLAALKEILPLVNPKLSAPAGELLDAQTEDHHWSEPVARALWAIVKAEGVAS